MSSRSEPWSKFLSGRVVRPHQLVKIELRERGFHYLEIRRDVEVARRIQTVMPDVHDLAVAVDAGRIVGALDRNVRKNGIAHLVESRGNQGRADRAGWVAAAEGQHTAAPA